MLEKATGSNDKRCFQRGIEKDTENEKEGSVKERLEKRKKTKKMGLNRGRVKEK